MEVTQQTLALGNNLRDRLALCAHRLDVEVQPAGGVIHRFDEAHRLFRRREKVGLGSGERFHRDGHAKRAGHFADIAHGGGGALDGVFIAISLREAPLLGAAPDHDRPAHRRTHPGQVPRELHRLAANRGIGRRQVHPRRLKQQPMQADHLQPGVAARDLAKVDGVLLGELQAGSS